MQLGMDGSETAPKDIERREKRPGKTPLTNPMLRLVGPYAGPKIFDHPSTVRGRRARDPRCGDCIHLVVRSMARRYYKCELRSTSGSATSDHRVGWPACSRFEREKA